MAVRLMKMCEVVYEDFISNTIKEFAKNQVKAGKWKEEEAIQKAAEIYMKLLPQGRNTEQNYMLAIVKYDQTIGWLWYFYDESKLQKEAFIYDFHIRLKYQKKGYGKASLVAFEELAKEKGIRKISLHVFAHNERALNMYKMLGFKSTNISMTKKIM
ncbi:GNAT family N-acetyltransferase [Chengkuizengella axinellae]|uniref:GNAT family N-acetyltransferase n=1 Tax=Chengkuizengella axinellae TaxID=3064388 RepID=A0ABT9J2C6_9BACL|nr:GNAT family N-acetyltransferase [Chengkuizengella sp. 2205SS18-9]MDP5275761.1 GNAT family N-acetyltransferase [Chengkuizengella sp. 2205SS18-9]